MNYEELKAQFIAKNGITICPTITPVETNKTLFAKTSHIKAGAKRLQAHQKYNKDLESKSLINNYRNNNFSTWG